MLSLASLDKVFGTFSIFFQINRKLICTMHIWLLCVYWQLTCQHFLNLLLVNRCLNRIWRDQFSGYCHPIRTLCKYVSKSCIQWMLFGLNSIFLVKKFSKLKYQKLSWIVVIILSNWLFYALTIQIRINYNVPIICLLSYIVFLVQVGLQQRRVHLNISLKFYLITKPWNTRKCSFWYVIK